MGSPVDGLVSVQALEWSGVLITEDDMTRKSSAKPKPQTPSFSQESLTHRKRTRKAAPPLALPAMSDHQVGQDAMAASCLQPDDISLTPKLSKQDTILNLLRQPDGATLNQLMAATGWQAHSVRGFLSGTVRKKLALNLMSERIDGHLRYRIDRGDA